jgi:hypothetical protein
MYQKMKNDWLKPTVSFGSKPIKSTFLSLAGVLGLEPRPTVLECVSQLIIAFNILL